jgi:formylglycine-generating enzyme required for sulfatase activity
MKTYIKWILLFLAVNIFPSLSLAQSTLKELEVVKQDTDLDGIPDEYDQCPNTIGAINNFGCPKTYNLDEIKQENIGKAMPVDNVNLNQIEKVSIPGVNWKMSKYEITVGEYLAFCKKVNNFWPEWLEKGNQFNIYTGSNTNYKEKGISELMFDRPIMGISWEDAVAFCEWVGGRLPSADEWDYAASVNENKTYAGSNQLDDVAWYYANSRLIPESVGQKKPTQYGLYDMTGNVWEWTSSAIGNERLCKGGSVVNVSWKCKVSNWESRHYKHKRFDLGFRVLYP